MSLNIRGTERIYGFRSIEELIELVFTDGFNIGVEAQVFKLKPRKARNAKKPR